MDAVLFWLYALTCNYGTMDSKPYWNRKKEGTYGHDVKWLCSCSNKILGPDFWTDHIAFGFWLWKFHYRICDTWRCISNYLHLHKCIQTTHTHFSWKYRWHMFHTGARLGIGYFFFRFFNYRFINHLILRVKEQSKYCRCTAIKVEAITHWICFFIISFSVFFSALELHKRNRRKWLTDKWATYVFETERK